MAIISPSRIDPCLLTGCFRDRGVVSYGRYTQAPAPQGPGFGWHEPSVKAMSVSGEQSSRIPPINERDSSCWVSVLLLEEPSLL